MAKRSVKSTPVTPTLSTDVSEKPGSKKSAAKPVRASSDAEVLEQIDNTFLMYYRLGLQEAIKLTAGRKMKQASIPMMEIDDDGISSVSFEVIEVADAAEYYRAELKAISEEYEALN